MPTLATSQFPSAGPIQPADQIAILQGGKDRLSTIAQWATAFGLAPGVDGTLTGDGWTITVGNGLITAIEEEALVETLITASGVPGVAYSLYSGTAKRLKGSLYVVLNGAGAVNVVTLANVALTATAAGVAVPLEWGNPQPLPYPIDLIASGLSITINDSVGANRYTIVWSRQG